MRRPSGVWRSYIRIWANSLMARQTRCMSWVAGWLVIVGNSLGYWQLIWWVLGESCGGGRKPECSGGHIAHSQSCMAV